MRFRKKHLTLAALIVLLVIFAELFSRFYLDLGTPPLSMAHPTIEYLYQPNQDVSRFHNRVLVNQYSMRSEPFTQQKPEGALRVMVFGDSVVNGGNKTDHSALATTILQKQLTRSLNREVVVGNISAGSWGPGNWLAYLQEYGDFDADIIALVISSHDYFDNPKYEPLDPYFHPESAPVLALWEGVSKYVPQVLGLRSPPELDLSDASKAQGLSDLQQFLELAKSAVPTVIVFQHWGEAEMGRDQPYLGNPRVRALCNAIGIPTVSLRPYFQQAIEAGQSPYMDDLHPNDVGQALIAEALFKQMQDIIRAD